MKKIALILAVLSLIQLPCSIEASERKTDVSRYLVKKVSFPKKPLSNTRFVTDVVYGEDIEFERQNIELLESKHALCRHTIKESHSNCQLRED